MVAEFLADMPSDIVAIPHGSSLILFLTAALVLLAIPGPAVLYIVARSVEQGPLAGIVSTLGVATGTVCHSAAAALGLSAILVSSALAFEMVKYLGAGYLIYLGIRHLATRERAAVVAGISRRALSRIFAEAVVVNVLNPKTALFFLAFLPQFVDVQRGSVGAQIFVLGMTFAILGVLSDGLYALGAGSVHRWLGRRTSGRGPLALARRCLPGSLLVGLGVATALARRAESP